ncbi:TetR/AcrR family transcriptional regulator [Sphingopyxis indica]|uniref:TetR/AcrR family transcriptional regulator n=1 Tax=Sphingopyxis indica TaxID=436663 RepID=UPI0029390BF3|nr:TetR/AcrR family transcriptional regulator [Sphingopyxis indica]WOF42525.1 TetR/AcrR family transcriptional regulator [Sphingopyxis indica]
MSELETAKRPATEAASPKPQKRASRGRPVGDRDAQRRKLLRAGIKVIAEEGYSGASLRKVAKEAGHTTGAITYYFADKEAMVSAIIEYMFDGFDEMLDLGDEVVDHAKRYKRWVELNSNSDGWLAGFQLLARARHEPKFAAIYRERYESYRARLAEIIKKQQEAGSIRADIPAELLADTVGSIGDGWMIMLPIETERFAPERLDRLIDSIMQLLRPVPTARSS